MAARELEARLRDCTELYDREVPRIHDFERRIMARVAITPREERPRRTLQRDVLFSTLVAAAILGLVVAITAGVRFGVLRQPNIPARHSQQTQPSPNSGFAAPAGCPGWSANPSPAGMALPTDKMTSRSVGWANGALRTTDAGAHRQHVAPNAMRSEAPSGTDPKAYPPAYADEFLDSSHAWLAYASSSATSCFDHVTVFSTADGGQHWRRSHPLNAAIQADSSLQLQLNFIDAQHGWLFVLANGRISPDWFLYMTTDGGLDWQLLSHLPLVSSFCSAHFISKSVGFLGDCPNVSGPTPQLTLTRDGGKTWQTVDLPAPVGSQFTVNQPVFFDQSRGVIDVRAQTLQGNTVTPSDYLVVTNDGGQTWRALPTLSVAGYTQAFAFIDSSHFVALVGEANGARFAIYRSLDGGRTWTAAGEVPPLNQYYPEVLFVDSQHGFIDEPSQEIGAGPIAFLATADGGRTWKDIHPKVLGGGKP
jgi:photosystem II stability/assembly factor-like uncharacterized protein